MDLQWQLRMATWLEVRPYQYADYTDTVRTAVARSARLRLHDMRIPKTDPAWDEVRYRPEPNISTLQKPRNGILVPKKEPKGRGARANAAAPPSRPSAAAVLPPSPLGKNSVAIKRAGAINNPASKELKKPIFVVGRAIKVQDPAVESTNPRRKGTLQPLRHRRLVRSASKWRKIRGGGLIGLGLRGT